MDPERWRCVKEVYQSALERKPGERESFLSEACANDREMRREVESLLRETSSTETLLHRPAGDAAGLAQNRGTTERLLSGARLGPYQVLEALGAGGMGEVYRARDTRLGRTVALKILRTGLADRPDFHRRFEREARAISALNHPHVCNLYDIGEQDGIAYLVMEYVEGETLAARLHKGRLPLKQVLSYALEIASALAAAHSLGIVHRDLKPANLMVTLGGIKLLDFGIARFDPLKESPTESTITLSLTVEGAIIGTLPYMSPEQLRGKPADARSDIFSLGAVLYEMATGRRAFNEADQAGLIAAIVERDPPSISAVTPDAPAPLERIVRICLAKDPDDRWQSAGDLTRELRSARESPAPAAMERAERLELAHILFLDIVGYTRLGMEQQKDVVAELQRAVRGTPQFVAAERNRELIALPTGDGMALVFSGDPMAAAECSVEVARAVKQHPHLKLRMGLHIGPIYRVGDINQNLNVSGGGINIAQRVMDAGDAGHILLSDAAAESLRQFDRWRGLVHDGGVVRVKDRMLHVWSLYGDDFGNSAPPSKLIRNKTRRNFMLAAALLVITALVSVVAVHWFTNQNAAFDSLAVLPFENATGDASLDHLSEGITESLINSFGQISALKVMARSATAGFRKANPDLKDIGQKLRVKAVLFGRMTLKGQNWVVSAELADIGSGQHLWGGRYEVALADISPLPSTISREVVDSLHLSLTGSERQRIAKRHTHSAEAYRLYSLGRFHWNKRTQEDIARAINYYQQAIQRDPKYALAWTGVADCYSMQAGIKAPTEVYPKALDAVMHALQMDDTLGEAHASLGFITLHYEWDWPRTEQEYKRAIALSPSYATAHSMYARYLGSARRFDEAIAETRHAQQLDPTSLGISVAVGFQLYLARRYDEAIQQYRRTLEMDRHFTSAHVNLGQSLLQTRTYQEAITELRKGLTETDAGTMIELLRAYILAGEREQALKLFSQVNELTAKRYVSPYYLAVAALSLGDREQALDLLEQSFRDRSWPMIFLNVDPRFDSLRSAPQFQDLLRRLHFA